MRNYATLADVFDAIGLDMPAVDNGCDSELPF